MMAMRRNFHYLILLDTCCIIYLTFVVKFSIPTMAGSFVSNFEDIPNLYFYFNLITLITIITMVDSKSYFIIDLLVCSVLQAFFN